MDVIEGREDLYLHGCERVGKTCNYMDVKGEGKDERKERNTNAKIMFIW